MGRLAKRGCDWGWVWDSDTGKKTANWSTAFSSRFVSGGTWQLDGGGRQRLSARWSLSAPRCAVISVTKITVSRYSPSASSLVSSSCDARLPFCQFVKAPNLWHSITRPNEDDAQIPPMRKLQRCFHSSSSFETSLFFLVLILKKDGHF